MTAPDGGWRHNVGAFLKAHPAWSLRADATGYVAQRKLGGRPRGPVLRAISLDEMAARIAAIDAAEAGSDR